MKLRYANMIIPGITALAVTAMTQSLREWIILRRSQTPQTYLSEDDLFADLELPDMDGIKARHSQMIADGRNLASIVGDFYSTLVEAGVPYDIAGAILLQKMEQPVMVMSPDEE